VDVSRIVQLVDTHEYFSRVALDVFLLPDAGVREQCSDVASRYVFLYERRISESAALFTVVP
jgi:hypothetical protein